MYSVKGLLVFISTIFVAACAGQHIPVTADVAASLRGRQLATSSPRPLVFFVCRDYCSKIPKFALTPQFAYTDLGARIMRENAITDPTPHTIEQLRGDLQARYDLKLARQSVYVSDDDDATQIPAKHPEADLVLDVRVENLSVTPFYPEALKYRFTYSVRWRLIDARVVHAIDGKKGQVVARDRCEVATKDAHGAPTYDEMLADGARRLKQELATAQQTCAEQFRATLTGGSP